MEPLSSVIIIVTVLAVIVYSLYRWEPNEKKPPKQKIDDNPISKWNTKMDDDNGIAELIRQQEQTNRHFQKLIADFFWFRIGIVGLLIIGALGAI